MSKLFQRFLLCFGFLAFFGLSAQATNVKDYGAKGDGETDDTEAIIKAIKHAKDGEVVFPRGHYKITRTIEIPLAELGPLSISGSGGTGRVIMAGVGPAFRIIGSHDKGSALPSTVKPITWEKERMPIIADLEILGAHKQADGIELRHTMQATMRGLLIREVRTGIHLTSRNRNILIDGCHVYNASGVGILLDKVNIHQFIISASHISYCKQGGIKVDGGAIRNFQITGNDIEYNCDPEGQVSADILIDCSAPGTTVREGTISGNTIQAIYSPGGANIRFIGLEGNPSKVGLWSITGNHIGNQDINIDLQSARGVTIVGNTFMRGYDRNLVIRNSKNIVFTDNLIGRNEDYYIRPKDSDGVLIEGSQNVIFANNIVEGTRGGDVSVGGSVTVKDSEGISINDNQILDARFYGVQIIDSRGVMVSGCRIDQTGQSQEMLSGVFIQGDCPETLIRGNQIGAGSQGAIVNEGNGAITESNLITK